MRIVLVAAILIAFYGCAFSATIKLNNPIKLGKFGNDFNERIFETEINETLECIRYTLETGLPEAGIPSIASIEIPAFNVDVGALGFDGSDGFVNISGGVLNGLTGFYAPDLGFSISIIPAGFGIDITLVVPEFYLKLGYAADLTVDGMPIYGNGDITIDWKDVTFVIHAFLRISGTIEITDVTIYITIGDSKVEFTGWFNDEEHSQVLNDLVNDYLIPQWVNAQSEEINQVLGPIIEYLLNLIITGGSSTSEAVGDDTRLSLDEILEAIATHCDSRLRKLFERY